MYVYYELCFMLCLHVSAQTFSNFSEPPECGLKGPFSNPQRNHHPMAKTASFIPPNSSPFSPFSPPPPFCGANMVQTAMRRTVSLRPTVLSRASRTSLLEGMGEIYMYVYYLNIYIYNIYIYKYIHIYIYIYIYFVDIDVDSDVNIEM